jgi:hypothetical protein
MILENKRQNHPGDLPSRRSPSTARTDPRTRKPLPRKACESIQLWSEIICMPFGRRFQPKNIFFRLGGFQPSNLLTQMRFTKAKGIR